MTNFGPPGGGSPEPWGRPTTATPRPDPRTPRRPTRGYDAQPGRVGRARRPRYHPPAGTGRPDGQAPGSPAYGSARPALPAPAQRVPAGRGRGYPPARRTAGSPVRRADAPPKRGRAR